MKNKINFFKKIDFLFLFLLSVSQFGLSFISFFPLSSLSLSYVSLSSLIVRANPSRNLTKKKKKKSKEKLDISIDDKRNQTRKKKKKKLMETVRCVFIFALNCQSGIVGLWVVWGCCWVLGRRRRGFYGAEEKRSGFGLYVTATSIQNHGTEN